MDSASFHAAFWRRWLISAVHLAYFHSVSGRIPPPGPMRIYPDLSVFGVVFLAPAFRLTGNIDDQ